jgi:chromosome segregation ATPase
VAQAQRDQAAQQHKAAEQELGGLLERCSVAEASLADSRRLAEQAAEQHKHADASVADLQQQLGEACQQAAAGAEEAQELARQRDELQGQLAAMKKAQSVAEGKLVLSRQREAHFKVGAGGSCFS